MRNTASAAFFGLCLAWPIVRAADPPAAPPPPPTDLSTAPAPAPAASAGPTGASIEDLQKQLSDNQDKLSTALHSYELLNDENRQLKADAEKSAERIAALESEKDALQNQIEELRRSNAFYQAQASIVSQVDSLHTQLRQAQNQTAALAAENAELKTRIALASSGGAAGMSSPTRPEAYGTEGFSKPAPAAPAAPPAAAPAPEKAEGPRTHTVVEGDNLYKISKEYYGTSNRWDEILAANRKVIKNENQLTVGTQLVIP